MNNSGSAGKSATTQSSRFEFRVFGQGFEDAAFRMARLSAPVAEELWHRESDEIYIVSRVGVSHNIKIRDELLDIKTLSGHFKVLERWEPFAKHSFPMAGAILVDEVFPSLGALSPSIDDVDYGLEEFLAMIAENVDVQAVRINKIRQAYTVNDALCEVASVLINGAKLQSLCIESVEPERVFDTIRDIGLEEHENTSYPNAIKQVIGLS